MLPLIDKETYKRWHEMLQNRCLSLSIKGLYLSARKLLVFLTIICNFCHKHGYPIQATRANCEYSGNYGPFTTGTS